MQQVRIDIPIKGNTKLLFTGGYIITIGNDVADVHLLFEGTDEEVVNTSDMLAAAVLEMRGKVLRRMAERADA